MNSEVIFADELQYEKAICEGIQYCVDSKGRQPRGRFEAGEVLEYVREVVEDFKPGVFDVEFEMIFGNTEPLKLSEKAGVFFWEGYEPDF